MNGPGCRHYCLLFSVDRGKGEKGEKHLYKYHDKVKCCLLYTLLNLCSAIPHNVIIACLSIWGLKEILSWMKVRSVLWWAFNQSASWFERQVSLDSKPSLHGMLRLQTSKQINRPDFLQNHKMLKCGVMELQLAEHKEAFKFTLTDI